MGVIDRRPDRLDTVIDQIAELVATGRRTEARTVLADLLDDVEDAAVVRERLADPRPAVPLDHVKRDLGLGD
ncbi:MAG TPA: hypothetical protein VGE72_03615 [Azospirillum sp.]